MGSNPCPVLTIKAHVHEISQPLISGLFSKRRDSVKSMSSFVLIGFTFFEVFLLCHSQCTHSEVIEIEIEIEIELKLN